MKVIQKVVEVARLRETLRRDFAEVERHTDGLELVALEHQVDVLGAPVDDLADALRVVVARVWEVDALDGCEGSGCGDAVNGDSGESGEEIGEPADNLEGLELVVLKVKILGLVQHADGNFPEELLVRESESGGPGRVL